MPAKKNGRKPRFNKKRQFRKQRSRVVETKKREQQLTAIRNSNDGAGGSHFSNFYPSTITPIATTATINMLPLRPFLRMSKGTRADQMLGNEVFSKSLYLKGKITGLPANNSLEAFLVTGWVRDRLGYTPFTSPSVSTATRQNVEDFIFQQCRDHFDSEEDEMRYRTAKKDNIHIVKYQKLQHPNDANYNDDINFKASWRTNRKITYTECFKYDPDGADPLGVGGNNSLITGVGGGQVINLTDVAEEAGDTLGGDIGQYLPLNTWLPFALVYIPQWDASHKPLIAYNSVHYFTG